MKKLLRPRELMGTTIQLMVFAALLPFIAILLDIIMQSSPEAKDKYVGAVLGQLPLVEPIQNVIGGMDLARPGMAVGQYLLEMYRVLEGNIVAAIYLGTWLYIFRVVFSELIKIPGVPIFQVVCGLFFGAFTYAIVSDPVMRLCAISFLVVASVVVTFFVDKEGWKKFLSMLIGILAQSYLSVLVISYVAVLAACFKGLFANLTQSITAVVIVSLLMSIYIFVGYTLRESK